MIGKYLPTFSAADLFCTLCSHGDVDPDGFKRQLGAFHSQRHVFLFRSARSALSALLRALAPTGTVIIPAYTCIAVPEAVSAAGWKPAFADAGLKEVNMTAETLQEVLPGGAGAVVVTHQFGIPCDLEGILEICRGRNMFVIEDAAPALGARHKGKVVGSFGDATVLSFHMTKVVSAGAGGALLTNDDDLASKIAQPAVSGGLGFCDFAKAAAWWLATRPACYAVHRRTRSFIRAEPLYTVEAPSISVHGPAAECSRYVASLAARQVSALASNLERRRLLARTYSERLCACDAIDTIAVPDDVEPAWIQFPIFVDDKKACYEYMLRRGVDVNWTFRYCCGASYGKHFPNSERAARKLLGLPTYPGLSLLEAERICRMLWEFARN